jgi:hypothetical protein
MSSRSNVPTKKGIVRVLNLFVKGEGAKKFLSPNVRCPNNGEIRSGG